MPFEFQGGLLVRIQMNKNHITDFKGALRTMLIGLLLHAISCHVKILLQNVKNLITVCTEPCQLPELVNYGGCMEGALGVAAHKQLHMDSF